MAVNPEHLTAPPPRPGESPPADLEAERAVLGAILVEPVALNTVMERLEEQDFYLDQHRIVYGACITLQQRGQAADLLTVTNHLREEALLERVGGAVLVSALVDALPDIANVAYYAEIVFDKAVKRRLMHAARSILDTCGIDQGEAKEAVALAQQAVYKIAEDTLGGGLEPIAKLTDQEILNLEKAQETHSTLTGIDTGYYQLNDMTAGLQKSDLVILAARPSMGKTSLAVNICAHAAIRTHKKVAIFSLEMSSEQLVRRLLSSEARVDQKRLTTGYLSRKTDWPKIMEVAETLKKIDLWIDDTPGITVMELSAKARRLKQEHGLDLVMVDYMQLMSGGSRHSNRTEEVSAISRGLKGLAKELNVPLLVLSQLSRRPEQRGSDRRPQLSDLRESGSIEQDADVVMFILRPSMYDDEAERREAELIIAKQRNGPTGEIPLVFQNEFTRFENADTHHQEPGNEPF
ncbi:MAG: replicative DNA helicase [Thermoanaerobaculales bacterium]|nr:replicative DNA helicase [Thermoanaerobaculales bacterium]